MPSAVSVVIPTYNGASFIAEALRSVLPQTLQPREVIVVDDHSSDDTTSVVATVAKDFPFPVKIIRLSSNSGGPAKPINVGIGEASGDLIAILDQDDVLLPDKIQVHSEILARDGSVSCVGGGCRLLDDMTVESEFETALYAVGNTKDPVHIVEGAEMLRSIIRQGMMFIGYPALTFRKSQWAQKGGVDETLPIASDYDFVCWLALHGRVAIVRRPSYFRRRHAANLSHNRFRTYWDVARVRARYLVSTPSLLQDRAYSAELNDWFRGVAHWCRQNGDYDGAFRTLRLLASVWGWDIATIRAASLLPVHSLLRKLTGRALRD